MTHGGFNMKILFVCTANICRSPLAEVILKKKLQELEIEGVEVISAGILDLEGEPRDSVMSSIANQAGYEMGGGAVHLTPPMTDNVDLIICMEQNHVLELQKQFVSYARWSAIHLFNEICFGENTNMPDPSEGTYDSYINVFRRIEDGCIQFCKQSLPKFLYRGNR